MTGTPPTKVSRTSRNLSASFEVSSRQMRASSVREFGPEMAMP